MVPRRAREKRSVDSARGPEARKRERLAWALGGGALAAAGLVDAGQSDAASREGLKRRGMAGLTRHGARQIEEFCRVVRQDRGLYAMWTVTLPRRVAKGLDSIERGFDKFAAVIRRRFSEMLARACARERGRRPCLPDWAFVIEPQAAGVPHFHFVFRCRSRMGRPWLLSTARLDGLIQNAARVVTGLDVDVPAAGNVQALRKDPGRYLSKYLRKGVGASAARTVLAMGWTANLVPSQWWGISVTARALLLRYTFEVPGCLVDWLSSQWPGLAAAGMLRAGVWRAPGEGAPSVVCGSWRNPEDCLATILYLVDLQVDAVGSPCSFGIT
jgi:hypothetical protein